MLIYDRISFRYCVGFKRNNLKCIFHSAALSLMTSQYLKCVDFAKHKIKISREGNINFV